MTPKAPTKEDLIKGILPSYEECEFLKDNKMENPLIVFILENEPAGEHNSLKFREELLNVLKYFYNAE